MKNGDALMEWRHGKGLTQVAAGKLVGVEQGTWAAWEAGRAPDLHNALKLEKLTDGSVPAINWPAAKKARRRVRLSGKRPAAAG
jgi:DNA-binding XRE family transcriptional regulator